MAQSAVELVNQALTELGERTITALDDNTRQAESANRIWEHTRDQVVAMHPWNGAVKRAKLAKLGTSPVYGFDNAFQLPSDLLRVLDTDLDRDEDWAIEDDTLVTDCDPVSLRYIRRVKNVPEMGLPLQDAIIGKLKAVLAMQINANSNQAIALERDFWDRILPDSRLRDSRQDSLGQFDARTWLDARHSEPDPVPRFDINE